MSDKKLFVSKCINPTSSLTKEKEYVVFSEDENSIVVINDNGIKVKFMRERFGTLEYKDITTKEENYILCVSVGKFKSITKGKTYELVKETKDFYYIINNLGKEARYGKSYFSKQEVKVEQPKILKAICIFTVHGELSFKKSYDFTEGKDGMIQVTNDVGVKTEYLKKRFNFEMQ